VQAGVVTASTLTGGASPGILVTGPVGEFGRTAGVVTNPFNLSTNNATGVFSSALGGLTNALTGGRTRN
jgi:hypothetical protein